MRGWILNIFNNLVGKSTLYKFIADIVSKNIEQFQVSCWLPNPLKRHNPDGSLAKANYYLAYDEKANTNTFDSSRLSKILSSTSQVQINFDWFEDKKTTLDPNKWISSVEVRYFNQRTGEWKVRTRSFRSGGWRFKDGAYQIIVHNYLSSLDTVQYIIINEGNVEDISPFTPFWKTNYGNAFAHLAVWSYPTKYTYSKTPDNDKDKRTYIHDLNVVDQVTTLHSKLKEEFWNLPFGQRWEKYLLSKYSKEHLHNLSLLEIDNLIQISKDPKNPDSPNNPPIIPPHQPNTPPSKDKPIERSPHKRLLGTIPLSDGLQLDLS